MENTFFEFPTFRNPYYEPPRPYYYDSQAPSSGALFTPNTRSVSVRQPARPSPPHPKVVSIPVHFVGTEKSTSAAAVKIQKVFRGFLVKTAVKKVLRIAAEVAEVERRVARKETVEMVRREEKERLRLNEMLMSLLFRLDSISGFDSGVRDCRKRVIRRVIALQEKVDAIAAGDTVEDQERTDSQNTDSQNCSRREGQATDTLIDQSSGDEDQGVVVADDAVNQSQSSQITDSFADGAAPNPASVDQISLMDESAAEALILENATPAIEKPLESQNGIVAAAAPDTEVRENSRDCNDSSVEPMGEALESVMENYPSSFEEDKESELERGGENYRSPVKEIEEQRVSLVQCAASNWNPPVTSGSENCEDYRGVMEKMVEENVKLQRLVGALCERNVHQSRLINSLSQRVEQLERVVARKKKKTRQATQSVDDITKCGKKL